MPAPHSPRGTTVDPRVWLASRAESVLGLAPLTIRVFETPAVPGVGAPSTSVPPVGPLTTMWPALVTVFEPPGPVALRLTVKVPAAYECTGLRSLELVPSPNVQAHDVTAPVEVSVNDTASGALPEVGAARKAALGAGVPLPPGIAAASSSKSSKEKLTTEPFVAPTWT